MNKPVAALVLPEHRRRRFHRPALSTPSDTARHLPQLHSEVPVVPRAVSLKLAESLTQQHDLLNH